MNYLPNIKFDKEKILDVQWLDLDEIRHMTKGEVRGYNVILKDIKNFKKKIYSLEIFDNKKYNG